MKNLTNFTKGQPRGMEYLVAATGRGWEMAAGDRVLS